MHNNTVNQDEYASAEHCSHTNTALARHTGEREQRIIPVIKISIYPRKSKNAANLGYTYVCGHLLACLSADTCINMYIILDIPTNMSILNVFIIHITNENFIQKSCMVAKNITQFFFPK